MFVANSQDSKQAQLEHLAVDPAYEAQVHEALKKGLSGVGLLPAAANFIMQLAMLPIGRGVAESRVYSGRADKQVVKRTRTTLGYLTIANFGSDEERRLMRNEVGKSHRHVQSSQTGSDVEYNAFSKDLQLWVAACLSYGTFQVLDAFHGPIDPKLRAEIYKATAHLGTTLQVAPEQWPRDLEAFNHYWDQQLQKIQMDDVTREHLISLTRMENMKLPGFILKPLGDFHMFVTMGFLPAEVRTQLRVPWSLKQQRRHTRLLKLIALINRPLPEAIKRFPYNVIEIDTKNRLRKGTFVGDIELRDTKMPHLKPNR